MKILFSEAFAEIKLEDAENLRNLKGPINSLTRGPKEMFIKKGSQLKLMCDLRKATERPNFIFW